MTQWRNPSGVAIDMHQAVAFDRNRYGVPRPFASRLVTVKSGTRPAR